MRLVFWRNPLAVAVAMEALVNLVVLAETTQAHSLSVDLVEAVGSAALLLLTQLEASQL
jgi:hypothetical protein